MSTLGKGLESLIPPKRQGGGGDAPALPTTPAESALPVGKAAPFVIKIGATHEENKEQNLPSDEDALSAPRGAEPQGVHSVFPQSPHRASSPYPAPAAGQSRAPSTQYRGENASIFQIEVDNIRPNPHQPRRTFDEGEIRSLAASIREFGVLQPIVVSKIEREMAHGTEVEYELIAGERRLMAAKMAGLPRIPAIIRHVDADRERLELAIIENLQREDLSPIEMARAFARLQDEFRLTQREIATRLGKSREAVANTVRLLDLPLPIQEAIGRGDISESHGRLLLGVTDPKEQQALFDDLLHERFTTRELRARALHTGHKKYIPHTEQPLSPEFRILQEELSAELKAPVTIYRSGEEGGRITISFYSKEELEQIIARLREENGD